jgi:hypothetical protein
MTDTASIVAASLPTLAVLVGILINRSDANRLGSEIKDTRNSLRAEMTAGFDKVDKRLVVIESDMREFYAVQARHDEAIDTIKKKVGL